MLFRSNELKSRPPPFRGPKKSMVRSKRPSKMVRNEFQATWWINVPCVPCVQVVLSKEATRSSDSLGDGFTSRMTCFIDLRNVVYRELATEKAFSRSNLRSSAIRSSSVAHCSDSPCLGDQREKKRTRVPPFLRDNIMDFLFRMPPFVLACDWSRPGVFLDGFLSRIPPPPLLPLIRTLRGTRAEEAIEGAGFLPGPLDRLL